MEPKAKRSKAIHRTDLVTITCAGCGVGFTVLRACLPGVIRFGMKCPECRQPKEQREGVGQ
jgi:hypothetical protein